MLYSDLSYNKKREIISRLDDEEVLQDMKDLERNIEKMIFVKL